MPKRKQPQKQSLKSLEDFLKGYENPSLVKAAENLQDQFAWQLFIAFLQYQQRFFEIAALDMAGHTGKQMEAAKASGYSQALEDVATRLIPDLINLLMGRTGVVEDQRPEDN